jgi:hypothetical protein
LSSAANHIRAGQHIQHDLQRGGVDHEAQLITAGLKGADRVVAHFYEATSFRVFAELGHERNGMFGPHS